MQQYNVDPNRTLEQILADIRQGAIQATSTSSNVNLIGAILAPFAALLVKLSSDAALASERLERLTRRLFWATIVLLVATVVLAVKEVLPNLFVI
jgi:hypothetical protein